MQHPCGVHEQVDSDREAGRPQGKETARATRSGTELNPNVWSLEFAVPPHVGSERVRYQG